MEYILKTLTAFTELPNTSMVFKIGLLHVDRYILDIPQDILNYINISFHTKQKLAISRFKFKLTP